MRLFSLWVSDCSPFTLSICHIVTVSLLSVGWWWCHGLSSFTAFSFCCRSHSACFWRIITFRGWWWHWVSFLYCSSSISWNRQFMFSGKSPIYRLTISECFMNSRPDSFEPQTHCVCALCALSILHSVISLYFKWWMRFGVLWFFLLSHSILAVFFCFLLFVDFEIARRI